MFKFKNSIQLCEQLFKNCSKRQNFPPYTLIENKFLFARQKHATSVRSLLGKTNIIRTKRNDKEDILSFKWVLLIIPVASFGLGCWQVQRRKWKLELIQSLQDRSRSTPVELPQDLEQINKLDYCPVKVKGHFIHDKELLMGPRALINEDDKYSSGSFFRDPSKGHGFLVITPFKLINRDETILINRGWVPSSLKHPSKRQQGQVEEEIELTGVVRLQETRGPFMPKNQPSKGQWLYRDLDQMSHMVDSSPIMLDARGPPDMPDGWPIPNQTRVTLRNEHSSYITTWFGLSGFTSWMWIRMFIQKLPLL